jgi:exopolyphosphatase/guanosine-5'-triphosphate,3'-diphosphate pyrophosphatase
MNRIPETVALQDPVLAASRELGQRDGRDPGMPAALDLWTAPLFPGETADAMRLRQAACFLSDVGSHDHPEYRAEQSFLRVLRQPGVALDHHGRAFLALTIAIRYEADPTAGFLAPAQQLLDAAAVMRAGVLGHAMRLAYVLSAGTPALLAETSLSRSASRLLLRLSEGGGAFLGEGVTRRLERLAAAMGLEPVIESLSTPAVLAS